MIVHDSASLVHGQIASELDDPSRRRRLLLQHLAQSTACTHHPPFLSIDLLLPRLRRRKVLFRDLILPKIDLRAHISHHIRVDLFGMGGRRVPQIFRIGLGWRDTTAVFLEVLALHGRILEGVRVRLRLVILRMWLLQEVSGHRHRVCLTAIL